MKKFSIFRVIFTSNHAGTTVIWVDGPNIGLIGRVLVTKLKEFEEADDEYIEEVCRHATELFLMWDKTWELGSQNVKIAGTTIGTIEITEIEYYGS